MARAVVVLKMVDELDLPLGYDVIGVDYGAYICAKKQIEMKVAIGDFDSVKKNEMALIKQYAQEIIQLPTRKDETDGEMAIIYATKQNYEEIMVLGALGGRLDHELANLYLLMYRYPRLIFKNQKNEIRLLEKGSYHIQKHHRYLSLLAITKGCISEKGVAYPLDHHYVTNQDIFLISNEIIDQEAIIEVHEGSFILMQCDD